MRIRFWSPDRSRVQDVLSNGHQRFEAIEIWERTGNGLSEYVNHIYSLSSLLCHCPVEHFLIWEVCNLKFVGYFQFILTRYFMQKRGKKTRNYYPKASDLCSGYRTVDYYKLFWFAQKKKNVDKLPSCTFCVTKLK